MNFRNARHTLQMSQNKEFLLQTIKAVFALLLNFNCNFFPCLHASTSVYITKGAATKSMFKTIFIIHLAILECFPVPVIVMIACENACENFFLRIAAANVVGVNLRLIFRQRPLGHAVRHTMLITLL